MKAEKLLEWYANLAPNRLQEIDDLYHTDCRFIDPFNDVIGPSAIMAIFRHMYRTTDHPRFVIQQHFQESDTVWVQWQFLFELNGREVCIDGVTQLLFGEDGLVRLHRDYWDASALMQELAWVGKPIAWLRGKLQAPQHDSEELFHA